MIIAKTLEISISLPPVHLRITTRVVLYNVKTLRDVGGVCRGPIQEEELYSNRMRIKREKQQDG